ncbi:MAG: cell division protein DivIVA [Actinomycetaceae bacterium]|nr:cell division protein DivIVA [Actinomycetaceae bacterium]
MSEVFPLTRGFKKGYNPAEVDDFFARARAAYEGGIAAEKFSSPQVRNASFGLVRAGYETGLVDAALDRLEAAFVKRDRADHMAVNGQQAWLERVANRATTLYPRMTRPEGERFAHPKGLGYRVEDVDAFIEELAEYFDYGNDLVADDIRAVTFRAARNEKAYEEGVVDAYLARAIEILLAVE